MRMGDAPTEDDVEKLLDLLRGRPRAKKSDSLDKYAQERERAKRDPMRPIVRGAELVARPVAEPLIRAADVVAEKTAEGGLAALNAIGTVLDVGSRAGFQWARTSAEAFYPPPEKRGDIAGGLKKLLWDAPTRALSAAVAPSTQDMTPDEYIENYWGKEGSGWVKFFHRVIADPLLPMTVGAKKGAEIMVRGVRRKLTEKGLLQARQIAQSLVAKHPGVPIVQIQEQAGRELARLAMSPEGRDIFVRPAIAYFGKEIPGTARAIETAASAIHAGKDRISKAMYTVAEQLPFGVFSRVVAKIGPETSRGAREATAALAYHAQNLVAMTSGTREMVGKMFYDAAKDALEIAGVKISKVPIRRGYQMDALIATEMEKMSKYLVSSKVLESPVTSTGFRRIYEGLPEPWKRVVDWWTQRRNEQVLASNFTDVKLVKLSSGDQIMFDKAVIDRGELVVRVDVLRAKAKESAVTAETAAAKLEAQASAKPVFSLDAAKQYGAQMERARATREAAGQMVTRAEKEAQPLLRRIATLDETLAALSDEMGSVEYLTHMITPEARVAMERSGLAVGGRQRSMAGVGTVLTPDHASQIQRKYRGMTIPDINALFRAEHGTDLFTTEARTIMATREVRHVRSIEAAEAARDIGIHGLQFDKTVPMAAQAKLAPKGHKYMAHDTGFWSHPAVRGRWFPQEIVTAVDKYMEITNTHWVATAYDAIANWWKMTTLVPYPMTSLRDIQGGLWNNFLRDAIPMDPVAMKRRIDTTFGILTGRPGAVKTAVGETWGYEAIRKMGREERIIGGVGLGEAAPESGWTIYGAWERSIRTPAQKAADAVSVAIGRRNPIIKYMSKFRGMSDELTKVWLLVDRLEKGDTWRAAVNMVKETHFSPEMLIRRGLVSAVERTLQFPRLYPFYRWSRMNFPFQLERALSQPYKLIVPERVRQWCTEMAMPDASARNWLTRFVEYAGGTVVDYKEETGDYKVALGRGWLSFFDIYIVNALSVSKNLSEAGKVIMRQAPAIGLSGLTPILKVPLEYVTGQDLFTGRSLRQNQPQDFLGITFSGPNFIQILKTFRVLKTLHDFTDTHRAPDDKTATETFLRAGLGLVVLRGNIHWNAYRADRNRRAEMAELESALRRAMSSDPPNLRMIATIERKAERLMSLPLHEFRD